MKCTPRPTTPPTNPRIVPRVGTTAFAITSLSWLTTCGVPALTADRKNRFTASTARALMYSGMPVCPESTTNPVTATITARISAP
jgi:hypothetical protein